LLNVVGAGGGAVPATKRRRASSFEKKRSALSALDRLDLWERETFHLPLQQLAGAVPGMQTLSTALGATCTGEGLVCGFAFLCWCLSVEACTRGIWLVPVVEVLNGLIKWVFGRPRPGWNDPRVDVRSVSHEYSFPSSHAMLSWSLATFFAFYWQAHDSRGDMSVPYACYALAMGVSLSRVIDGAHYPHDILVGGVSGHLVGAFHHDTVLPFFLKGDLIAEQPLSRLVLAGYTCTAAMLAVTALSYTIATRRWGAPSTQWQLLARVKNDDLQPHFVPLFDYVGMCGVFAGLASCEPTFDAARAGLSPIRSRVHGVSRLTVGLTVLVGAWFAVRAIEKGMATRVISRLVLRFLRYFQVPVIILYVSPALFEMSSVD
jgi:membrane-associated phospholipid phosphatase